jgi:hypothetical protein
LKDTCEWHRREPADAAARLAGALENGSMTAQQLLSAYCRILYERLGTYEAVARATELDRRTVKKYIEP